VQGSQQRPEGPTLRGQQVLGTRRVVGIEAPLDQSLVFERLEARRQGVGGDAGEQQRMPARIAGMPSTFAALIAAAAAILVAAL